MITRWIIDAVHRARVRCVIDRYAGTNRLKQAAYTFHKAIDPMARANNIGYCFYSIIERHGA